MRPPHERWTVPVVRVLTVDDHASFRNAVRSVLEATEGFTLGGEVETGEDGVRAWTRLRPDLTLMDVRLPGISGYEAARRITHLAPDALVVLVSAAEEAIQGDEAARCGAVAFVRKLDVSPHLLEDLWRIHGPASASA
jgi:DNA-binding NarL/FixJ family response regulator